MDGSQLRELQKKELEILLEIDHLCKKHHLTYYLIGGSALGSLRHEGFIPWDDDIDLAMPRRDYQRFLEIGSKEFPDTYFVQTYKTQPDFPYPFAKVNLNNTTFLESRLQKLNIHHGVFVDVFPLDGVPKRQVWRWAEFSLISRLRWAVIIRRLPFGLSTSITFWRCFAMDRIMSRVPLDSSKKWANIIGGRREIMDRAVYGTPTLVNFEGHQLPVPNQCEAYLRNMYGSDYMTIPPVEERYDHNPLVVDLNNSYLSLRR